MDVEEQHHIESLLKEHRRRLRLLEQRSAKLGTTAPPELITEIEDLQAVIDQLQARLHGKEQNSHLSPKTQKQTVSSIERDSKNHQSWVVPVMIVLVGALATIGAAWIAKGTIVALESTNTAQQHEIATATARITEVTPLSQSETASPATTPAQSSATAVPGNTSPPLTAVLETTAQAEPTPTWTTVAIETFDSTSVGRWSVPPLPPYGQLAIDIRPNGIPDWVHSQNIVRPLPDNFRVTTEVVSKDRNGCDYGITFKGDGDNYYFFYINETEQDNQPIVKYGVRGHIQGQDKDLDLIELKQLQIQPSVLSNFTLSVLAEGSNYILFVNGNPIDNFTDVMINGRKVGIGVMAYQEIPRCSFTFDNFEIAVQAEPTSTWTTVAIETFDSTSVGRWSVPPLPPYGQLAIDIRPNGIPEVHSQYTGQSLPDYFRVTTEVVSKDRNGCDYGITFKGDGDNYYFFYINETEQDNQPIVKYGVRGHIQGQDKDLIELKQLQIQPGVLSNFTLSVLAEGSNYTLFVNGNPVGNFTTDGTINGHKVGIRVMAYQGIPCSFTFDNFETLVR